MKVFTAKVQCNSSSGLFSIDEQIALG